MRTYIDLMEGFFSGDDDCWIDADGSHHKLNRQQRETHREFAVQHFSLDRDAAGVKHACAQGWIRIWVERSVRAYCFIELDMDKVSRKAVKSCIDVLSKFIDIENFLLDDSNSSQHFEFDNYRSVIRKLKQITLQRDLNIMFEQLDEVYSTDHRYLKQHLSNNEFDGYRYWSNAEQWARSQDEEELEDVLGEPLDGEEPEQYEKLTPEMKKDFEEWVLDYLRAHDPAELPSSDFFDNSPETVKRETWLVHFTDHGEDIVRSGFTHGTYDVDQLGLTTYLSHSSKKYGGFNFAFEALSREARNAAHGGKYGRDFVVFQSAGVKSYHYSDEENQVIFWGPNIDRRHIALAVKQGDEYHVLSRTGMTLFRGSYERAVQWIITNHRQYARQLYS